MVLVLASLNCASSLSNAPSADATPAGCVVGAASVIAAHRWPRGRASAQRVSAAVGRCNGGRVLRRRLLGDLRNHLFQVDVLFLHVDVGIGRRSDFVVLIHLAEDLHALSGVELGLHAGLDGVQLAAGANVDIIAVADGSSVGVLVDVRLGDVAEAVFGRDDLEPVKLFTDDRDGRVGIELGGGVVAVARSAADVDAVGINLGQRAVARIGDVGGGGVLRRGRR